MLNAGQVIASALNTFKAGKVHLIEKDAYTEKLIEHFSRLNAEDRRMRFGVSLGQERIEHYVKDAIKHGDHVFAIFNEEGQIVGALHMAKEYHDKHAYELGLSVNAEYRKLGYGRALFEKGVSWAKTLGAKRIYTYCLSENRAMQHLSRSQNLRVMLEHGDYTGELQLEDRTTSEITKDLVDFATTEQMMIFDRMSERYVTALLGQYAAFAKSAELFQGIFKSEK